MNKINRFIVTLAVISIFTPLVQPAAAQGRSGKAVHIVVPFPSGGPADLLARLLADQIGQAQGPTMVIDNRPGASSDIGTKAVSRAVPDGSTLLIAANNLVITKHTRPSLGYDPLTSFEPICMLAKLPMVVVVNGSSPYSSLLDFLTAARARPGQLTVAAFGPASPPHIAEESIKRIAEVDWTYVPFPGDAPAVTALLGGHVTALVATYSGVMEQAASGQLRLLATTGRERIAAVPEVPTLAEYADSSVRAPGYKDFDVSAWLSLLAPARTPLETIVQLERLFASALQAPEVKSKLLAQGIYPNLACGTAFAERLKSDYEFYGRVIREVSIRGN